MVFKPPGPRLCGRRVQDVQHPLPGRRSALYNIDDPAERDERPCQQDQVAAERHELAERQPPADDVAAADPDDQQAAEAKAQRETRIERRLEPNEASIRRHVVVVGKTEACQLGRFLSIRADNANAGERFLDDRAHVGQLGLDALEPAVDRVAEVPGGHRDARQRQQGDEGEPEVDPGHDANGDHEPDHRADEVHHRRPDEHPHGRQIVGGARHQVAGAIGLKIFERQPLEVAEKIVAEGIFNLPGGADKLDAHQVAERAVDDRQPKHDQGIHRQPASTHSLRHIVNRVFEYPRRDE